MRLWQVKWFRMAVIIFSSLFAVGIIFGIIFIRERSFSQSPTPSLNSTPLPSFQGQLPEPKTLGVVTKEASNTPILMYHHIQDVPINANSAEKNLSLSPTKLKEEIKYLADSGYKTAILSELFDDVSDKRVVLTFDDGYKDLVTNALPILKQHGFRAVAFIIVDDIGKAGYINWGDIQKLIDEGWEIGSHSLTHPNLKVASIDVAKEQIIDSKKILENRFGIKIEYFSYPAGKYNETTAFLLKETGYVGAVTIDPGVENLKTDIFALRRLRIISSETLTSFKSKIK